jgi:phospholipid/cholesterol/gamma-HCH transport system ATP-binding protein
MIRRDEPEADLSIGPDGNDVVISIEDVYKSFGKKVVLAGVSFRVHKDERVVIMGPSGTGKSVLLRHICGLTKPDRGTVRVLGKNLEGLPRQPLYELRLQIGVLFQGAALLDSMNVQDNVLLGLRAHTKLSERELREVADVKLAQVGLPGTGLLKPAQLSGGMRKRVGLARAIAMEPRIILYDEPTTGLDPVMSDVINELILQVARPGVTSVVVTHDLKSAYRIGTRFLMLHNGSIVFDGDADTLRNTPDPRVAGFIAGKAETFSLLT